MLKTPKTDTSVTYKLKLSGGDIKAVQGDSGHAQADMVTEVYGHILDEDRRKNAELMENAFYNKENLNPNIHEQKGEENTGGSRSRIADESTWQSGDGSIAYFIGEDNESINIEERYCVE